MSNNGEAPARWEDGEVGGFGLRNLRLVGRIGVGLAVVIVVIVALFIAKSIFTNWLWFDSLGFVNVYSKILVMRVWLFFGGMLVVASVLLVNLYFAYRFSRGESILPVPPDVLRLASLGIIAGVALTVLIMSVVFGVVAQGRWETFLVYFNRVPFGIEDPQFHKDMSFHIAVMPMLHFIQGWFMGIVIASLVAVVALYLAIFGLRGVKFTLTPRIRGHLAVLGGVLMLTIAAAHYLDIFELVYSGRGAAPGAGYTDVNARNPVLWLLVAIAMVSSAGFFASLRVGGLRLMVASFSLWAVLAIVAGAIYPMAVQRFRVNPNEFDREEQYIERAINFTREAYNLNLVDERPFSYKPNVDAQTLDDNLETIENIRLWDHRPLRDTYNQIQAVYLYYNFLGVDVDRYHLPNGEYRQVMLSGRELFPERLEEEAQNWVNRKLAYTHGFGVAMSPVTEHTDEGQPEFILKDLPPTGDLPVRRPEIYYGENTRDFVVVNTKTDEFNFQPEEGDPDYSNYEGEGGVKIGSFFRRVAFAWQMVDFNLLISGQVSSESRIMYRRQIQERVRTIAPFLLLDHDPYLVVGTEGKLWWIQDAYTVTDRYAYSARFADDYNYIRNSVKVVIDPYNGSVHLFVREPDDPLVNIYRKAFPDLFLDFELMDGLDPLLREHTRYPLDLFSAQSEIYLRFHMTNPREFFERGDLWARAQEVFESAENTQDVEPYYVIMKLPGEEEVEFVLLLPFTPGSVERKNMVGWMAARNDGDNYGKLVTFTFPGQVVGPEQIEGRITSDETIGVELSLLCPSGGDKVCVRGNLLAIPMGESILYVEPLYLRPKNLAFPELKKVIVADTDTVVMADTLTESLDLLRAASSTEGAREPPVTDGAEPDASVPDEPPPRPPEGTAGAVPEIQDAIGAVERLRTDLEALEQALRELEKRLGGSPQ